MMLKGSQRAGGMALGNHLTNTAENDHVEIYELRGFVADDLHGAFQEVEMVASGTKATQPFFHVSFSPPQECQLTLEQFERAFDAVESQHGLQDQPRAVVFHEKLGRRHAHVAWSRIDVGHMRAINLPFFKDKLKGVSLELHHEFGLEPPPGLKNKNYRDPNNFDFPTWQQCKRIKEDPRDLKQLIRRAYQQSDNREAFAQALEQHALFLARGERRGYVALHHSGEVLSIGRYAGVKAKDVRERFGSEDGLRTLDQARSDLKSKMSAGLERRIAILRQKQIKECEPYKNALLQMRRNQRRERYGLARQHQDRWKSEELARAKRLRSGLMGLWDRITGKRGKVSRQNVAEEQAALTRDKREKQDVINRHGQERRVLQKRYEPMRKRHRLERQKLLYELSFHLGTDDQKRRPSIRRETGNDNARATRPRLEPQFSR